MALFSERYGYTKASDVIIREQITPEIQNAICSCYDHLKHNLDSMTTLYGESYYAKLEAYLWEVFLNKRASKFYITEFKYNLVSTVYIEDKNIEWFLKLNIIEKGIEYLLSKSQSNNRIANYTNLFIENLNLAFERLNFAYRIIGGKIVEITSEQEIKTIEGKISTINTIINFICNIFRYTIFNTSIYTIFFTTIYKYFAFCFHYISFLFRHCSSY